MLSSIVQTLVAWGLSGLLLVAVLDSAGVPLPTGVDLLLTTLTAVQPSLAYLAIIVATIGSTIGCLFLFYVARKGGQRYLDQHTQTGKARQLREWFQRYGLVTVFVSVLSPIPLPTKVFVLSAGALGVRPLSFLLAVVAGRVPRYIGLAYLGSQLGTHSKVWLREHTWHLAGIALVLVVTLFLLTRYAARPRT